MNNHGRQVTAGSLGVGVGIGIGVEPGIRIASVTEI